MFKKTLFAGLLIQSFSVLAANPAITSDIINNKGKKVGRITLTQGTEGVIVNIKASKLPAGYHGMHFHSVADCSDKASFKKSKGHVNPDNKPHGFKNSQGPHEGNLPNLIVAKNGKVEVELYTQMISLTSGSANLLDKDGSALIIHIDKDDHTSQPIGGSGSRIACAEIKK